MQWGVALDSREFGSVGRHKLEELLFEFAARNKTVSGHVSPILTRESVDEPDVQELVIQRLSHGGFGLAIEEDVGAVRIVGIFAEHEDRRLGGGIPILGANRHFIALRPGTRRQERAVWSIEARADLIGEVDVDMRHEVSALRTGEELAEIGDQSPGVGRLQESVDRKPADVGPTRRVGINSCQPAPAFSGLAPMFFEGARACRNRW